MIVGLVNLALHASVFFFFFKKKKRPLEKDIYIYIYIYMAIMKKMNFKNMTFKK
jgi:hypothetical protein